MQNWYKDWQVTFAQGITIIYFTEFMIYYCPTRLNSSSQERYPLSLFPSLDINLLLNAINKYRCMNMYILTEVNTLI